MQMLEPAGKKSRTVIITVFHMFKKFRKDMEGIKYLRKNGNNSQKIPQFDVKTINSKTHKAQ